MRLLRHRSCWSYQCTYLRVRAPCSRGRKGVAVDTHACDSVCGFELVCLQIWAAEGQACPAEGVPDHPSGLAKTSSSSKQEGLKIRSSEKATVPISRGCCRT